MNLKIKVHDYDENVTFDFCDDIFAITDVKGISPQLFEKTKLYGDKKVDIYTDNSFNFLFDARVLPIQT